MLSAKYSEAAVEVLDILEHMEKEDYEKVPQKFINMLEESASKDYVCNLDYSKRLMEMDLREETKSLLGVIYRNYWCPEGKKAEFESKISENERKFQEELRKKYNPNNIFGDSSKSSISEENSNDGNSNSSESNFSSTKMIEYEETSILKKILNKIISIFKR